MEKSYLGKEKSVGKGMHTLGAETQLQRRKVWLFFWQVAGSPTLGCCPQEFQLVKMLAK